MNLPFPNRPALGYYLRHPDGIAQRQAVEREMQLSRLDHAARARGFARLVTVSEGLRQGRRLDLVADDLRHLADDLDELPNSDQLPETIRGGWPILTREAA